MLNYILFILYTLSEPNGNRVIKYLCNLLLSVRLSHGPVSVLFAAVVPHT